jgi:hypothetical protein
MPTRKKTPLPKIVSVKSSTKKKLAPKSKPKVVKRKITAKKVKKVTAKKIPKTLTAKKISVSSKTVKKNGYTSTVVTIRMKGRAEGSLPKWMPDVFKSDEQISREMKQK